MSLKISFPSAHRCTTKSASWMMSCSAKNGYLHLSHIFAVLSSSLSVNLFISVDICAVTGVCLAFYQDLYLCMKSFTLVKKWKWVNSEERKSYCMLARTFLSVIELIWVCKRKAYLRQSLSFKQHVTWMPLSDGGGWKGVKFIEGRRQDENGVCCSFWQMFPHCGKYWESNPYLHHWTYEHMHTH